MYSTSSSFFDEVTNYNVYNCRLFLSFVDKKYSRNKKARTIKTNVDKALNSLNLIEKLSVESTFKLKSDKKIHTSLEKVIKDEAEATDVNKNALKKEVYLAFRKIRSYLKHY